MSSRSTATRVGAGVGIALGAAALAGLATPLRQRLVALARRDRATDAAQSPTHIVLPAWDGRVTHPALEEAIDEGMAVGSGAVEAASATA